jgi:hypothetical protein
MRRSRRPAHGEEAAVASARELLVSFRRNRAREVTMAYRGLLVLVSMGLVGSGCVSVGPHATMHPSAGPLGNSAGVSAGVLYGTGDEDTEGTYLAAPYGEGWARFGAGTGQFELRMTPGLGFLSYRIEVMPREEPGGFALGLVPSLGLGLVHWDFGDGSDISDETTFLTLAPNLSALLWVGNLYMAPRFGYTHLSQMAGNSDSTGLLAVGGNLGYAAPSETMGLSVEAGFQRISSTEEGAEGATYLLSVSVGLQR